MGYAQGSGTLLQLSIASVFTTIAQRVEIEPPERSRVDIETTDLDSTNGTYIPCAVLQNGELRLKVWHDASQATHAALLASLAAGTSSESWKMIFSDTGAEVDAFSGFLKSYKKGTAKVADLIDATIVIKISGAITNTP